MSENSLSLSDKIARLCGLFVAELPGRIAVARKLLEILRADSSDSEAASSLNRFFHSIKGTGASFGFAELSALSGKGEEQTKVLMGNSGALTGENWQRLDECLSAMERVVEDLVLQGRAS